VSEEHRLKRPLLAGDESESVRLRVLRIGRSGFVVRPVRKWRDGREVGLPKDVSEQRITSP